MPIDLTQSKLSAEDVLRQYMEKVVNKQREQASSKLVNLRSTNTPSTALRSEPTRQGYFEPVEGKVRLRDWLREMGSLGKKGVDFLISSERDFGQTLGDALATMSSDVKEAQKAQESLDNMNMKLGKTIVAAKKQGKDTSQLEDFYKRNTGQIFNIEDIIPSTKKTAKQIFGEGLGVATDIAAFGTYGQAAKGAKTGKLLKRSRIIANKAMMGKPGQVLRKELTKRRFGDFAQKVNLEVTGNAGITSKVAKAVANINPNNVDDPIKFMRLAKDELAKFGLNKNKKLLRGLQQTAFDFRMIQEYGKPIYTAGQSSLTAGKAFLRSFKELGKKGAGLGAGVAASEALKKNEDFMDVLRATGKGALGGGLVAGTVGGLLDANEVLRYNKAQALQQAAKQGLIAESKKFNTAEDFISSKGKPFYHGTTTENAKSINEFGFDTTLSSKDFNIESKGAPLFLTPVEKKAKDYGDDVVKVYPIKKLKIFKENSKTLNSDFLKKNNINSINDFVNWAKKKGFDYVERSYGEGFIINPSSFKTEQQLTDIFNLTKENFSNLLRTK